VSSDKSLPITKAMVWKAYQLVKRNGKAAGVDGQSLDDFAQDLENSLSISSGTGWHLGVTSRQRFGVWRFPSLVAVQGLWAFPRWAVLRDAIVSRCPDGGQAGAGAPVGADR